VEDGRVTALRQFDDDGLFASLPGEVLLQPFSELRGLHPYQVVLARVIAGRPAEDRNADLLLGDGALRIFELPLPHVQKEFPQAIGSLKSRTGADPVKQLPLLFRVCETFRRAWMSLRCDGDKNSPLFNFTPSVAKDIGPLGFRHEFTVNSLDIKRVARDAKWS
jgi:hypothetical protein